MKVKSLPIHLTLAALSGFVLQAAGAATELAGTVEQKTIGAGAQSKSGFLQGGIKDEERMRASLMVFPGNNNSAQPKNAGVSQYAGANRLSGPPAPIMPGQSFCNPPVIHRIAPISTVTPRNGVMVFEPGYEVTTVTPPPIPSAAPPPRSAQISNTPRSGVTSFDPDYAVKSVAPAATGFLPVARGGVVSWLAGYDVTPLKLPVSDLSVTPALVPCGTPAAAHGVVAWAPGFEVRLAPAPTQFTHETIRETLGGLWTTSNPLPLNGSSLQGKLASQGLQAQAKLLPGLQTSDRIISWNDWYNRVSHAIYDRWENADTGPGTVRIRCVVKSTCNISAQVTGFTAAPDLERDVIKETQFRETALRSVNLVDNTPVLEFPFMSNRHEVTFELDLKRSVDGPGRCEVVFADSETVHR